jgi:large subunit ribosomal protein L15
MSMTQDITAGLRNKRTQRKGRGESSGRGKTSGRGNKGSGARVGTYIKRTYEGGQTEIFKRFPKRGFSNENFERRFHVVNLGDLARFDDGTTVDQAALKEAGLVPDKKLPVKILGDGGESFTKKLTVSAGWYSRSAYDKITAAGGAAQNAKGEAFEFPKPKKKFVKREAAPAAGGGKKSKKGAAQEPDQAEQAAAAPQGSAESPKPEQDA